MNIHLPLAGTTLLLAALPSAPAPSPPANNWVIGSGEVARYDTSNGPLLLDNLRIEAGATLRVYGPQPFVVRADRTISINGTLDLSGFDASDVWTLNTANQPEVGAAGGPGGAAGGTASANTTSVTLIGEDGGSPLFGVPGFFGGLGGEGGWSSNQTGNGIQRRAAGGGGGVLAPDQPVNAGDLSASVNLGLVAFAGRDGSALATGSTLGGSPPQGGAIGAQLFSDGDATNDFFGRKNGGGGVLIQGELASPTAGEGGGAGGDAVYVPMGQTFPPPTLVVQHNDKGGAGGGGGGFGLLQAGLIKIGAHGRVLADGGKGGGGENTSAINRIGGGGGGGSGGMMIFQARFIDMSLAGSQSLRAHGGRAGSGANNVLLAEGGGGHGGPGLIQLHVPQGDANRVALPAGMSLADLSSPTAHVLHIESGL